MTESLLLFFLGRGTHHIPVGMEMFYSHQVSWSSEDVDLLGGMFRGATVEEESIRTQ